MNMITTPPNQIRNPGSERPKKRQRTGPHPALLDVVSYLLPFLDNAMATAPVIHHHQEAVPRTA